MTELERSNSLPVLAARIRAEHEAAESDMRETVQHALTCGRWLLEAKAHPELKHGQWLPWLRDHCGISERTAQLYMWLALQPEALKSATRCGFESVRGVVTFIAKKQKEARVLEIKERRWLREEELADATRAASKGLGKKLYGVILADPAWRYEWPPMGDVARLNEKDYPSMALDDIKALPIPAADDCVLFLWATIPHLRFAFEVMEAWGFDYRSAIVWHKVKNGRSQKGTGYWARGECELLLIGRRGNVVAPAPGEQLPAFIEAPRGRRNSEKPDIFADEIARLFPNVPKIEMFARKQRDGWDYHGNEVVSEAAE